MFSNQMKLPIASKFTYRLGTGLKAGADMVRLLQTESTMGPQRHRDAMLALIEGVKSGDSLSALMEQHKYFPRVMASMTRVGEETGKLEHALLTLSEHYQRQIETRRWFITSITWPALQLVAAILIISLLIWIQGILTPPSGGQMADLLGWGLRGTNGVLWFWLYLSIIFGGIGLVILGFAKNVAGVQNLIPLVYMIPGLGSSIQTITISRFCWTLALALGSGLDPIRSIRLALDSTDSDYYRGSADDAENAIRGGASLAGALDATGIFPHDFIQRVDIAEHSGTDAESIDQLAKEYDERAKMAVKFLAGAATIVIRVAVMLILIYFIFRIMSVVLGFYNINDEPLERHRKF